MADISNKTFATLLGIALFVSAMGMFSTGNNFFGSAGFAITGSGQSKVEIGPLIDPNLTNEADFENEIIAAGEINCEINETSSVKCPVPPETNEVNK